jgi:hypothetical protein
MNKRIFSPLLCLALASTLIPSSESSAAIIYEQAFTGGTGPLAGSTPTVENYVGDNVWTAAGGGSIHLNGDIQGGGSVVLPFVPQAGQIYTLTSTLNWTSSAGDWIGVGFFNTNSVYGFLPGGGRNTPTVLSTKNGQWQLWPQAMNLNKEGGNIVTTVLDTTQTNWTVSHYQNGSSVAMSAYEYMSGNPIINYVGFVSEGSQGTINSFQLSAIPEPASFGALAGFLAIGLVITHRRRS